jgi:hypothetical protein
MYIIISVYLKTFQHKKRKYTPPILNPSSTHHNTTRNPTPTASTPIFFHHTTSTAFAPAPVNTAGPVCCAASTLEFKPPEPDGAMSVVFVAAGRTVIVVRGAATAALVDAVDSTSSMLAGIIKGREVALDECDGMEGMASGMCAGAETISMMCVVARTGIEAGVCAGMGTASTMWDIADFDSTAGAGM